MIAFNIWIDSRDTNKIRTFYSTPLKNEWEKLADVFNGSVRMSYYKKLLLQLEEIIARKRFNLEEGDEIVPTRDPSFWGMLEVDSQRTIITNLNNKESLNISTIDFRNFVNNWIIFVEVNTKTFGTSDPNPYWDK